MVDYCIMKILIAGGAGFLGSHVTEYLLAKGNEVTVVDSLVTGVEENITPFKHNPLFKFYNMDVSKTEFLKEFHESDVHIFDRVYDLACPTGVPNIQILGEEMIDACSAGTKNTLLVAQKNKAKFLLTSSSEIYGDPEVFPQSEDYTGNVHPQNWRSSYEEGKRFAETIVSLFVIKYKVDAKTVRLFNAYGPNMSFKDQRVIPVFAQQALKGEPLTVHENNAYRTMCYVTDIVKGLEAAIEKGEPGGIYNLGSDKELTMKELAEKVIAATQSTSPITFVPGPKIDHKRRMPDLTRIKSLDWDYSVTLEEGLVKTIENFKARLA
jgi:nucleoside-diphosphate-sugar epimerase